MIFIRHLQNIVLLCGFLWLSLQASPADPETPTDEKGLEETENALTSASVISDPESPPPPIDSGTHSDSQEASLPPEPITSTTVPSQPEQREDGPAVSETVGEPADRVGPEKTPVMASPLEVSCFTVN